MTVCHIPIRKLLTGLRRLVYIAVALNGVSLRVPGQGHLIRELILPQLILPKPKAEMITTMSTSMLRASTGMVIFVGNAARFTISDIAIATVAVINKTRFIPVNATMPTVNGVRKQPVRRVKYREHQSIFSCPAVQAAKRGIKMFLQDMLKRVERFDKSRKMV